MESGAADSPTRDYERIARAIGYLRRHAARQPDLAAAARHVHLSEFHFQRLFTRWAGVSPKRFLQVLTLGHAKARLAAARSVLDVAGEVGLSGPGRLHELFVTLEAATPGQASTGGAGMQIRYGLHDTPFGRALVAVTARGICGLQFAEEESAALDRLRHDWPRARLRRDPARTAHLASRIFEPLAAPAAKPLALLVRGTNFQLKVWRALLALPCGAITTYGRVAQGIGEPAAARAVGNAVGANPIAYLIPCHRVLRESGEFGGYRWGETRKVAMLGWEAARAMVKPVIGDS
jgi:AraC family transcriptional regulator, regulatory protein of adaptative response / methylated-DNA-[protein]-cysteine methyltransferase